MLRCSTRFESFLAQTPLGAKLALVNQPHYKVKPWGQNKKNNTHNEHRMSEAVPGAMT